MEPGIGQGGGRASGAAGLGQHQFDQVAGSSRVPLNRASPPSPWRRVRSASERRSMAAPSAAGAWRGSDVQQRRAFRSGLSAPPGGRPGCVRYGRHRAASGGRSPAAGNASRGPDRARGRAGRWRRRSGRAARSARGRPAPRPAGRRTGCARRRPGGASGSGGTRHRRWRRRNRNGRARRRCGCPPHRAAGPAGRRCRPTIQSPTRARARMRAASVPITRRSRSQVKPCAWARITGWPAGSAQASGFQHAHRCRTGPVRRAAAGRRGPGRRARDRAPAPPARPAR